MTTHSAVKGKLIAVIGDEVQNYFYSGVLMLKSADVLMFCAQMDTCVGFLLGGIGEMNKNRQPNFMVVDKNTPASEIEECFKSFIKRDDIDIILINQNIAEMIRYVIDSHVEPIPSVLEIPSKDHPYDPTKDSILRRAKGLFSAEEYR